MELEMKSSILKDCIDAISATKNDDALITLKDDRWIVKSVGPSDVIMAGLRVTTDGMEHYDRRGAEEVGLVIEPLQKFLSSAGDTVRLEYTEKGRFVASSDNSTIRFTGVVPDSVMGHMSKAPSKDYPVEVYGDMGVMSDFMSRADKIIGTDHFMLSPREEGLYTYAEKDNNDTWDLFEWEDFDNHSIDWSIADDDGPSDIDPVSDKAIDSMYSLDVAQNIKFSGYDARLHMSNHGPFKLLLDAHDGVSISYMMAPRVSKSGGIMKLPDEVRQDNAVL